MVSLRLLIFFFKLVLRRDNNIKISKSQYERGKRKIENQHTTLVNFMYFSNPGFLKGSEKVTIVCDYSVLEVLTYIRTLICCFCKRCDNDLL